MKTHNPTTMIKSKFSNNVHKLLEPNLNIKKNERWRHRDKYKLTDSEKIELFNKILILHSECSNELSLFQYNRRKKRKVINDRIKRGYTPKKKTKKEDYLKNLVLSN